MRREESDAAKYSLCKKIRSEKNANIIKNVEKRCL
jgi:hypothetical protein